MSKQYHLRIWQGRLLKVLPDLQRTSSEGGTASEWPRIPSQTLAMRLVLFMARCPWQRRISLDQAQALHTTGLLLGNDQISISSLVDR